jgi:hypothetical protein
MLQQKEDADIMRKTLIILTLSLFFIAGAVAWAQTSVIYSVHGKSYFSVDIPDNWMVNVGTEDDAALAPEGEASTSRLITAMPADGALLWFGMWVPDDVKNFSEAQTYLDSLRDQLLTEVETKMRKTGEINGMKAYYAEGSGKKEKEDMDFSAAFIQLPEEHVAIVIYIGPHETTITHGEELKQMLQSVRSELKPGGE